MFGKARVWWMVQATRKQTTQKQHTAGSQIFCHSAGSVLARLTCRITFSISAALMTIGPLTAYSTAFTCGFRLSMLSVLSLCLVFPEAADAAVASAVLYRSIPHRHFSDTRLNTAHWSRGPAINPRFTRDCNLCIIITNIYSLYQYLLKEPSKWTFWAEQVPRFLLFEYELILNVSHFTDLPKNCCML